MVRYVSHCLAGFAKMILTFLEHLQYSRQFSDALDKSFSMENDAEMVLWIIMHFHKIHLFILPR